jgi:NAD-dependent SIR2 family protein deacetylase
MYGRQLPGSVFEHVDEDFFKADLLIIVGTSLTVHPACDFINKVRPSVPRLLVNNQYVGEDLGMNFCNKSRDSALIGEIDNEFLRLINYLDWTDDLNKYRDIMCENSSNLL